MSDAGYRSRNHRVEMKTVSQTAINAHVERIDVRSAKMVSVTVIALLKNAITLTYERKLICY